MRTTIYALLALFVALPATGAAQTGVHSVALQADSLAAAGTLADAAAREFQRLQEAAKPAPAAQSGLKNKGKKSAGKNGLRAAGFRAKLQETERLRIRDKYRDEQAKRIAKRSGATPGGLENMTATGSNPAAKPDQL